MLRHRAPCMDDTREQIAVVSRCHGRKWTGFIGVNSDWSTLFMTASQLRSSEDGSRGSCYGWLVTFPAPHDCASCTLATTTFEGPRPGNRSSGPGRHPREDP